MAATNDRAPILVLGNGGFGTALSLVLQRVGRPVHNWGFEAEYTAEVERTRSNPKFLPGAELPAGIVFGSDVTELAKGAETVISTIPTQFLRSTLGGMVSSLSDVKTVISCSKGFERETSALPSEILRGLLPNAEICVLSGPSHAEEVAKDFVTSVVVANADANVAIAVQRLFSSSDAASRNFRTYTSQDPRGVEICGASKNVIALAAGISDGLGFGDNARAALLCRGLSEITRLGVHMGARPETFAGLSGVGDLVVTCTSPHSRNRSVGLRLGAGESLDEILASTETVAEGVETTRSLQQLGRDQNVELPIAAEVYRVLFEGKDARQAVADLMARELKPEV